MGYCSVAWLPAFYAAHGVAALTVQGMQMAATATSLVTLLFVGYLLDRMRSPRLPTMPVCAIAVIVRGGNGLNGEDIVMKLSL